MEFIQLLQNDFSIQRYMTLNVAFSGQYRIYLKTQVCRTYLLSILIKTLNLVRLPYQIRSTPSAERAPEEINPIIKTVLDRSLQTGKLPADWMKPNIGHALKKSDTSLAATQGSKCPSLPGFTHWVNPGKPGLGFKPYFGKNGEYWVIKYFKCSDVQNCANWWILRQVR